jgi:hypothetical protein
MNSYNMLVKCYDSKVIHFLRIDRILSHFSLHESPEVTTVCRMTPEERCNVESESHPDQFQVISEEFQVFIKLDNHDWIRRRDLEYWRGSYNQKSS